MRNSFSSNLLSPSLQFFYSYTLVFLAYSDLSVISKKRKKKKRAITSNHLSLSPTLPLSLSSLPSPSLPSPSLPLFLFFNSINVNTSVVYTSDIHKYINQYYQAFDIENPQTKAYSYLLR